MRRQKKKENGYFLPVLIAVLIVLVFIFVLFRLFSFSLSSVSSVVGDRHVLEEVDQLIGVAGTNSLQLRDLDGLKGMVEGDDYAVDEYREIEALVRHKEYEHVGHTLYFLKSYVITGKEMLCPGHHLAHHYLFVQYEEEELAARALKEADAQFSEWLPLAKEFDLAHPTMRDVDELASYMRKRIDAALAGNSSVNERDVHFFSAFSICVLDTHDQ
ncbi:MAG TPA: hypothetical protein VJK51_00115 [Candidatus Nanoarchaeia archaeon]|nr:hypothetical protein [Candidatus Nanoarchaeia archaeon]